MLPRWQRHWWERLEVNEPDPEPKVWVDASLYVERPPAPLTQAGARFARGTTPPPTVVGAYCALEHPAAVSVPEISQTEGVPLSVDD